MATQTEAQLSLEGGAIVISLTYDDVMMLASSASATNSLGVPAFVQATRRSTGVTRSRTVPVGGGSISLPSWPVQRLLNVLDGVDWYVRWPA